MGKKKKKEQYLNIFSTNAAQLGGKLHSFKSELKETNASVFTVQETHYATKGKLTIENYEIFEAIRNKAKGGTAIGVMKGLKPFLIEEYSEDFELLVVEIKAGNKEIRIITGYGPQECRPEKERMPFFLALEEEIVKAELAGKSIIIELDANSKLGPQIIPGDKHQQSENGKILSRIIERHGLVVGNALKQCQGVITRRRVTKDRTEESTIDFIIFSEDLVNEIETVVIDDKREHVLTKIIKNKKGVRKVESDHHPIISKIKLAWDNNLQKHRTEIFNLKNKVCQKKFKEETSSANNNFNLSSVFDNDENLNLLTKKFLKKLDKVIYKCFNKIRVTEKKDDEREELYKRHRYLKGKSDEKSKAELKDVENTLGEKYAKENFEKIKERTSCADSEQGGMSAGSLWSLKKELFPQSRDPPTAMIDPVSGNLLTSEEKIQEAAVKTYANRLENRPMKENMKHIKDAKEILCEKLIKVAQANKTPPWTMKDVEKVLKHLKKNKSRDPLGLCNELFGPEVAGDDLKLAIVKLMNRIKQDQVYPECLEVCNISSIWKRKGSRNNFDSYRGIFRVTIFRCILDRLIYNDEYQNIDANLTDCNVGARKERNIRDNIFVINAIMNSIKKQNGGAVDFQVYDIEKCFDALWLHEVINSLFQAGLQNDKLPLLFLENNNAQVAVKTSGGMSRRVNIRNIIMQGSVWGSICCVVLMDKLGQYAYSNPDLLYYYKGVVATPPLQMVDDILGIQKCSSKSRRLNNAINTFVELEKLTLSKKKCHNVHVGPNLQNCPNLKVHNNKMDNSNQETYLGDKIDKSGKIKPTIDSRVARGYGAVTNILAIVNEVPLAHWRVEAGLQLRQAMFINGTLFNSEAWQGITDGEIEQLEKVDEALLRGLLKAHSKAPLESLFQETGCTPIRYIIKNRRISYLHTILKKDSEEIVREVFEAQKVDPSPGDFYPMVANDCELIGLNLTHSEITKMEKEKFKHIVKAKIRAAAFKYLKEIQQTHSKVKDIEYFNNELSPYLRSPLFNKDDTQLLYALRTRTVSGIRKDSSSMYSDLTCPLGCGSPDTLPHIITCSVLMSHLKSQSLASSDIRHEDIFSKDIVRQKQVTELYTQLLEIREEILNSPPVAETGPVH